MFGMFGIAHLNLPAASQLPAQYCFAISGFASNPHRALAGALGTFLGTLGSGFMPMKQSGSVMPVMIWSYCSTRSDEAMAGRYLGASMGNSSNACTVCRPVLHVHTHDFSCIHCLCPIQLPGSSRQASVRSLQTCLNLPSRHRPASCRMQAFAKVQAEETAEAAPESASNGHSDSKQSSSEAKATRPHQAESASYQPPSWRGAPDG